MNKTDQSPPSPSQSLLPKNLSVSQITSTFLITNYGLDKSHLLLIWLSQFLLAWYKNHPFFPFYNRDWSQPTYSWPIYSYQSFLHAPVTMNNLVMLKMEVVPSCHIYNPKLTIIYCKQILL
jgi:hypothetical protein